MALRGLPDYFRLGASDTVHNNNLVLEWSQTREILDVAIPYRYRKN